MSTVDFEQVLAIFEANGWKLKKIHGTKRVFIDLDGHEPPIAVPVSDLKVNIEYYERIQRYFEIPQSS